MPPNSCPRFRNGNTRLGYEISMTIQPRRNVIKRFSPFQGETFFRSQGYMHPMIPYCFGWDFLSTYKLLKMFGLLYCLFYVLRMKFNINELDFTEKVTLLTLESPHQLLLTDSDSIFDQNQSRKYFQYHLRIDTSGQPPYQKRGHFSRSK